MLTLCGSCFSSLPGHRALGLPAGFAAAGMCSVMPSLFSVTGGNFELVNPGFLLRPDKPILLSTNLPEDFIFTLWAVTINAWSSGAASPLCCLQRVAVCVPSNEQADRFTASSDDVFSPLSATGAIVLAVVCPS